MSVGLEQLWRSWHKGVLAVVNTSLRTDGTWLSLMIGHRGTVCMHQRAHFCLDGIGINGQVIGTSQTSCGEDGYSVQEVYAR